MGISFKIFKNPIPLKLLMSLALFDQFVYNDFSIIILEYLKYS